MFEYLGVNNLTFRNQLKSFFRLQNQQGWRDAASLAISEKMRADSGLKTSRTHRTLFPYPDCRRCIDEHAILQRMRELAVQAATDK